MNRWLILLLVVSSGSFAACSAPPEDGPLLGPRDGGEASHICVQEIEGSRVYFGSQLNSTGDDEIVIEQIEVTRGENLGNVQFGLDHTGLDIGTAAHPAIMGSVDIGPMLKELHPVSQDRLEPADSVTLVISPTPKDEAAPAIIHEITISYLVNGTRFRERDSTTFELSPGEC